MYTITKTSYGFKLVFSGLINKTEIQAWVQEVKKTVSVSPKQFGTVIDMRELKPLDKETQEIMIEGQRHFKRCGMVRSAVVLDKNTFTSMQFKRLGKSSGIDDGEIYINAGEKPGWERIAEDWVAKGLAPKE